MSRFANLLKNWQLDPADVGSLGRDLQHPECVLAERDGSLWVADARGIMHILADGQQRLIAQRHAAPAPPAEAQRSPPPEPSLPNGMAFAANGDLFIANIGTGVLEQTSRDGLTRILYDEVEGRPIGKVNFVVKDSRNRLWISISTRVVPVFNAVRPDLTDGYIALADDKGIRIVADGFQFTNELRFDAREEWLYVVETTAQRICRLRVRDNGSLGEREVFGPACLGPGFPDGIAFDTDGNLWCAIAMADRLVALTPQGDLLSIYTDGDPTAAEVMDRHFHQGTLTPELMMKAPGKLAPGMASIAFGGPNLRTVFIGSSMGTTVPFFTSPVSGLPLSHHSI